MRRALFLLALVAEFALGAAVPIANTKHNLSSSGTGSIKSTTEAQICVFCHTPHGASTAVSQLWNKQLSAVPTYTMYGSDYLGTAGAGGGLVYAMPSQPKARSKLCMSCHDGTVAIGSVYNLPGSGGGAGGTIPNMQNTTAGLMPVTRPGYLGTSLTDDHPVGYLYDRAKDTELVARAWPWNTAVKLDPDAGVGSTSTGTIECYSCHNAHDNQFTNFLRMSNTNAGLCTFCHNKTGWVGSGHQTSAQAFTPIGGTLTTVAEYSCRNCHRSHTAGGKQLTRRAEELTCYDAGCHGTNNPNPGNTTANSGTTRRNIQVEMAKVRRHPTNATSNAHKDLPFVALAGTETPAQLGSTNRHAECPDCHNPHQVQPAATVEKSNRGNLRISLALKGTWGVQPTWPAVGTAMATNVVTFTAPTVYTVRGRAGTADANPVTDEYQVCLKCHSNYVTLPVGARNIAQEINPNNSSYHGIVPCPNAPVAPSAPLQNANCTTNFYVNQNTMVQPWAGNAAYTIAQAEACRTAPGGAACVTFAASRGRVWCSDCHGSDLSTLPPQGPGSVPAVGAVKVAPYGPHGSANNGTAWGTSNSDYMLVRSIAAPTNTYTPLCIACHKPGSYATGAANSRMSDHNRRGEYATNGCFTCHMWEAGNVVSGASGRIFPHGMHKRWATVGKTAALGSGQLADSFIGGSAQVNMNYATKQCWTANTIGTAADGSGAVGCNRSGDGY